MIYLLLWLAGLGWGLMFMAYFVIKEQGSTVAMFKREHELDRQEIQALTDALARGNRTPIYRPQEKKPLEKSETYWDKIPDVTIAAPSKCGKAHPSSPYTLP